MKAKYSVSAICSMPEWAYKKVYDGAPYRDIAQRVNVPDKPVEPCDLERYPGLADVELLFTSWGSARLDAKLLGLMPSLQAVFYGAGSIRGLVSDEFWARRILITSAYAANAIPVAEFTHAAILLSLKKVWHYARTMHSAQRPVQQIPAPGAYGATVGLVSLGVIGRMVAERLKSSDLKVVAYDPFVSDTAGRALGVQLLPLDELFRTCDVVSVHTPWLKETEGMITGDLLSSMKPHATLINTSRGAVIRENEMIEVLRQRPDLTACLDVTWPEPPVDDSMLYQLPNVVLTPHIAGSLDMECKRLGAYMVGELDRYLAGQPLRWGITREQAERMA